MEIKLKVLGCGDAFSSGGRFTTSFYVSFNKKNFLIDCGSTTLTSMKRLNISSKDIDYIFLSHFHGDHYGGLPYLLLDAAILQNRSKKLTFITPPGCEKKLKALITLLYPGSEGILNKFPIKYLEYQSEKQMQIDDIILTPFGVKHTKATFPHGLRLKIGEKVISFSGDTEWTDNLIPLSEQADLFLCECNFYHQSVKGHLNYKTLLEKKELLKSKKILLTHLGDDMLARQKELKFEVALEGREYVV